MSLRVIVSASSDIGLALSKEWATREISVIGTFRRRPSGNFPAKVIPVKCDLGSRKSRLRAISKLRQLIGNRGWDVLVLASGTTTPIGQFANSRWDDWAYSMNVNFLGQVQILHELMNQANDGAQVVFFAGGGTNGVVNNYSAYTVAKIAGIKLCELLGSEFEKVKFTSIGPGWVKTKIHQETLEAGLAAGSSFLKTKLHLENDDFFPIKEVIARVDWIISQPGEVVSGRNFSAVDDPFFDYSFIRWLKEDSERLKLRRFGNNETKIINPTA
jgi:NAD(P)-dependent dehydrogenase (short-subunit alcohol dehydrogenase family)